MLKTACGSLCYAAPEMLAGKWYVPSLCDIWSCGVVLFAMLCGYLPFEDESRAALCRKIIAADFSLPDFLSASARDIIRGMLTAEPKQRFDIIWLRNHEWLNLTKAGPPGKLEKEVDVDEAILEELEKLGFPSDYVTKCLRAHKHNHVTATYQMLLKKRSRLNNMTTLCQEYCDAPDANMPPGLLPVELEGLPTPQDSRRPSHKGYDTEDDVSPIPHDVSPRSPRTPRKVELSPGSSMCEPVGASSTPRKHREASLSSSTCVTPELRTPRRWDTSFESSPRRHRGSPSVNAPRADSPSPLYSSALMGSAAVRVRPVLEATTSHPLAASGPARVPSPPMTPRATTPRATPPTPTTLATAKGGQQQHPPACTVKSTLPAWVIRLAYKGVHPSRPSTSPSAQASPRRTAPTRACRPSCATGGIRTPATGSRGGGTSTVSGCRGGDGSHSRTDATHCRHGVKPTRSPVPPLQIPPRNCATKTGSPLSGRAPQAISPRSHTPCMGVASTTRTPFVRAPDVGPSASQSPCSRTVVLQSA